MAKASQVVLSENEFYLIKADRNERTKGSDTPL